MILSDGKNGFKIKQGTSWWETVFLGGSEVGFAKDVLPFVFACGVSFDVYLHPCEGAPSADDGPDPTGILLRGGGNKFELLDITEE